MLSFARVDSPNRAIFQTYLPRLSEQNRYMSSIFVPRYTASDHSVSKKIKSHNFHYAGRSGRGQLVFNQPKEIAANNPWINDILETRPSCF